MNDSEILIRIEKKMTALLALLVHSREKESSNVKLEVLLKNAGLDNSEISIVTGKTMDAVKKSIQRSKK